MNDIIDHIGLLILPNNNIRIETRARMCITAGPRMKVEIHLTIEIQFNILSVNLYVVTMMERSSRQSLFSESQGSMRPGSITEPLRITLRSILGNAKRVGSR